MSEGNDENANKASKKASDIAPAFSDPQPKAKAVPIEPVARPPPPPPPAAPSKQTSRPNIPATPPTKQASKPHHPPTKTNSVAPEKTTVPQVNPLTLSPTAPVKNSIPSETKHLPAATEVSTFVALEMPVHAPASDVSNDMTTAGDVKPGVVSSIHLVTSSDPKAPSEVSEDCTVYAPKTVKVSSLGLIGVGSNDVSEMKSAMEKSSDKSTVKPLPSSKEKIVPSGTAVAVAKHSTATGNKPSIRMGQSGSGKKHLASTEKAGIANASLFHSVTWMQPQSILNVKQCEAGPPPYGTVDRVGTSRKSVTIMCPCCRNYVRTDTKARIGKCTLLSCSAIWLLGLVCGCCLIPCFCPATKDITHYCPYCLDTIAVVRPLA